VYEVVVPALDGSSLELAVFKGQATLVVNVASLCGLTPQYAALQRLHDRFEHEGFSVLGVPCNQFGEQEPAALDEIIAFCSSSYNITFPLTTKLEVNGVRRHLLYQRLTTVPDSTGNGGDVQWNFEKFLVSRDGVPVGRFRSQIEPESEVVVSAIRAALGER
jgi:glutathione peroxidase